MKIARAALLAAGIAVGGYGAFLMFGSLVPIDLVFLAIWLAAVVLVHDGVVVPVVSVLRAAWLRGAATRPPVETSLVQIGFVVGGVLTLFVVPLIWAQGLGSANPTILVGNYAVRLLVVWVVIALVVLVASRLIRRRARS